MAAPIHSPRLERVRELDRALVKQARKIRILSNLGWPNPVGVTFLEAWRAGRRELPNPPPIELDLTKRRDRLQALSARLDVEDPLQAHIGRTAQSYIDATLMLEAAGTADFTKRNIEIYGNPTDRIHPEAPTHLEAADSFLGMGGDSLPESEEATIPSEAAASLLQQWIDETFADDPLPVEVEPTLTSLATAGSKRVRIRGDAHFSRTELEQLLQHEALVHSATARNGRQQPILTCLGLGAPRTTCVQEGLATLGEMITETMDVRRLRRIALRIRAVHSALEGADFVEVFEGFLAGGHTETEAFHSAHRVFRGGDVRGGSVFTKDVIYLKGMLLTHTFLLKAIQGNRHELPLHLFAGRMTLQDALLLAPEFAAGTIANPRYAPSWVRKTSRLSAFLSWTAFTNRVRLAPVDLEALDG